MSGILPRNYKDSIRGEKVNEINALLKARMINFKTIL